MSVLVDRRTGLADLVAGLPSGLADPIVAVSRGAS